MFGVDIVRHHNLILVALVHEMSDQGDSLRIAGHVRLLVVLEVAGLYSKQIILQVRPVFGEVQQFRSVKYGTCNSRSPYGRDRRAKVWFSEIFGKK